MAEQKRGSLKPVTYIWININYLQENFKVSLSNSTSEFLLHIYYISKQDSFCWWCQLCIRPTQWAAFLQY